MQAGDDMKAQFDLWSQLATVGQDAWQHIGDSASSQLKRIGDQLKSSVLDLLYQLTIKKWILSIGADVTGNSALAAAASSGAGSGLGGLIGNGLSGIFGSTGGSLLGATGGFGAGATAGLDSLLINGGLSSLAGGSLTAILGPIIATMPWLALAGIAVPMIAKLFDKGPAMRSGTFASNSALTGGNTLFQSSSAFGTFGITNDKWFSDADMGAPMKAMLDNIKSLDNAIAAMVGKDKTAAIKAALQSGTTHDFGIEHTDINASGVVGTIMKERYDTVLTTIDTRFKGLLSTFEGTGAELASFVLGLVGLEQITKTLPPEIEDGLLKALNGTAERLQEVTKYATAFADVQLLGTRDPAADAQTLLQAQSASALDAYHNQAAALRTLISSFDGSADAAVNLATATQDYYKAQVQLLIEIEQVRQAVTGMFGDTARNMKLSTLDNTGKYQFYQDEAAKLKAQLQTETDPEKIKADAEKINADAQAAFNLLDPAQQKAALAQYLKSMDDLTALVNKRLDDTKATTTAATGETIQEVQAQLAAGVTKLGPLLDGLTTTLSKAPDAAATQLLAANTNLTAANTVKKIALTVTTTNGTTEVNSGGGG